VLPYTGFIVTLTLKGNIMAAFVLGLFAPLPQKKVSKPVVSSSQRTAVIDKLCKSLGSQYRNLKQYRGL
jgi:hypothetical protein